jgi:hypothetical protein
MEGLGEVGLLALLPIPSVCHNEPHHKNVSIIDIANFMAVL